MEGPRGFEGDGEGGGVGDDDGVEEWWARSRVESRYGGGEESTVMGEWATTMAVIRTVRVMEGIWRKRSEGLLGKFYGELGFGVWG